MRLLGSTKSQKNDANDGRSVAIVALHQPGLRMVTAQDHVAVLRMLAKRHTQLSSLKTQAACRPRAMLAGFLAEWAKRWWFVRPPSCYAGSGPSP